MAFWSSISVRVKLIAIIGTILVIGFLTTNLISFRVSSTTLKETILHNELPLTSSNIYSEIQADLLRPIFVSSLMSNDTFLKDWILNGEKDPDSIRRYLDEIRIKYDVFTSFLISGRTKTYYHFSGPARVIDETNPDDVWFARVRDMPKPYEINIDYNHEQGKAITIFVNYRVLDYDGNFLAVTGVGLKVDTVANIVARYGDSYQRNIYFVDGDGRITVRSGKTTLHGDDLRHSPGIAAIADDILKADHGFFEYDRDGETMLLTTRNIPELGWRVIVEQRESDAMRSLWKGFLTNLVIGALIVVITIITIGYAVNIYQKKLEVMATTDKLTGIGNRQVFDIAIAQTLKSRRRMARPLAVILFDIDHFKQVNDRLGHLKGDQVIRAVALAAKRQMRASDVLCRWGGEEIIVLADDCSLANAIEIAEKLRAGIAATPLFSPDDGSRVTISAGVADYRDGDTADAIIDRADIALYRAKQEGRNRVVVADAESTQPHAMPVN